MNIRDCLRKRFLIKIDPDMELADKEMREASYDLDKARKEFESQDHKWCIVKCYYSMFHAAKAVLFRLGYREKKHIAILIVLEELNKQGKLESRFITYYRSSLSAREDADYHYSYSREIAQHELEIASEFIEEMRKLLR